MPGPDYARLLEDPKFRRWFGKSAVRAPGRLGVPIPLFHGTETEKDFTTFSKKMSGTNHREGRGGFFFADDPEIANYFANPTGHEFGGEPFSGARVIPAFLSLQRPLGLREWAKDRGINIKRELSSLEAEGNSGHVGDLFDSFAPDVMRTAKRMGKDSIYWPTSDYTHAVAFDPRQIKSVFNRGTWDPRDPRINYAGGGKAEFEKWMKSVVSPIERSFVRPRPALRADLFDPKEGIGAVPDNQSIDHFGFTKPLTMSEWRTLAPRMDPELAGPGSTPGILDALKRGQKLGNPFFNASWDEKLGQWEIAGHEGRHRMEALRQLLGDAPETYPVHIFPRGGMRARDISPEMMEAPFLSQDKIYRYKRRGGLAMAGHA